jgi:hypothetical protein
MFGLMLDNLVLEIPDLFTQHLALMLDLQE